MKLLVTKKQIILSSFITHKINYWTRVIIVEGRKKVAKEILKKDRKIVEFNPKKKHSGSHHMLRRLSLACYRKKKEGEGRKGEREGA